MSSELITVKVPKIAAISTRTWFTAATDGNEALELLLAFEVLYRFKRLQQGRDKGKDVEVRAARLQEGMSAYKHAGEIAAAAVFTGAVERIKLFASTTLHKKDLNWWMVMPNYRKVPVTSGERGADGKRGRAIEAAKDSEAYLMWEKQRASGEELGYAENLYEIILTDPRFDIAGRLAAKPVLSVVLNPFRIARAALIFGGIAAQRATVALKLSASSGALQPARWAPGRQNKDKAQVGEKTFSLPAASRFAAHVVMIKGAKDSVTLTSSFNIVSGSQAPRLKGDALTKVTLLLDVAEILNQLADKA